MRLGFEPGCRNKSHQVRSLSNRIGLGLGGWDLSLTPEIWSNSLKFGSQGQDLGQQAGILAKDVRIWGSQLRFGPQD